VILRSSSVVGAAVEAGERCARMLPLISHRAFSSAPSSVSNGRITTGPLKPAPMGNEFLGVGRPLHRQRVTGPDMGRHARPAGHERRRGFPAVWIE